MQSFSHLLKAGRQNARGSVCVSPYAIFKNKATLTPKSAGSELMTYMLDSGILSNQGPCEVGFDDYVSAKKFKPDLYFVLKAKGKDFCKTGHWVSLLINLDLHHSGWDQAVLVVKDNVPGGLSLKRIHRDSSFICIDRLKQYLEFAPHLLTHQGVQAVYPIVTTKAHGLGLKPKAHN